MCPDTACAQQATYEDQASYYETSPYDSGPLPVETGSFSVATNNFPDYQNFYSPSSGSSIGTVLYTGSYGPVFEPTGISNNSVSFFRLTDDINENGTPGSIVVVEIGQNGVPLLTTLTDFGDLHQFNIAFDQVSVARQSGLGAYDAGGVYWIYENGAVCPDPDYATAKRTELAVSNIPSDSPKVRRGTESRTIFIRAPTRSQIVPEYTKFAVDRRGSGVGLTYGFYECALFDRFRFDADGGILGRTFSDTRAYNLVAGPQFGFVAFHSFGPLTLYAHNFAVIGLNDGDMRQNNGVGSEPIPGATNRLLYGQPISSENRDAIDEVAPAAVFWLEAALQVTERMSFKVALSSIYVNNIALAEERVIYYLPTMGLRDPGDQNYEQHFLFCGIEIVR